MSASLSKLILSTRPIGVFWGARPMRGAVPEKSSRNSITWKEGIIHVDGPFIACVDKDGFEMFVRAAVVRSLLNGSSRPWVTSGSIPGDDLAKLLDRFSWDVEEGALSAAKPKLFKGCDVEKSVSDATYDYQAIAGGAAIYRAPHGGRPGFTNEAPSHIPKWFAGDDSIGAVEVPRGFFGHMPSRPVRMHQEGNAVVWSSPDHGDAVAPTLVGTWRRDSANPYESSFIDMVLLRNALQAVTSKKQSRATLTRCVRGEATSWVLVRPFDPNGVQVAIAEIETPKASSSDSENPA